MQRFACVLLFLGSIAPLAHASDGPVPRIAVLPTQFEASAAATVPTQTFDEAFLTAVQHASGATVLGHDDFSTVLGYERQKELLACDELACATQLLGSFEVHKLVVLRVARFGDEWALSAKLVTAGGSPVVEARLTRMVAGGVNELLRALANVAADLFGGARAAAVSAPVAPAASVPAEAPASAPEPVVAPAPVALRVEGNGAYEPFRDYIGALHWRRYVRQVERGAELSLVDWVRAENEESTGLFVTELATCLGLPTIAIGADSGEVFLVGLLGCGVLAIFDGLDVGNVPERSAPPQAAYLIPERPRADLARR